MKLINSYHKITNIYDLNISQWYQFYIKKNVLILIFHLFSVGAATFWTSSGLSQEFTVN